MRILFDYQCLLRQKYGGVSRCFYELYKIVSKKSDVKIKVIKSQNHYFEPEVGEYHYANKAVWYFYRIINWIYTRVYLFFSNDSIDILHPTYFVTYGKWVKRKNIKMVVTVHDMIHERLWSDKKGIGAKFTLINKRKMIHDADAIIAVSENTKKDLLEIYPEINPDIVHVIYHGVNSTENVPRIPNEYGKYILFVGTRDDYKNFVNFIKGISKLLIEKEVLLICAGGGTFTVQEKKLLSDLEIDDRVLQMSVSDEVLINLYRNAICFVYPSLYEGFGIPILEAFEAGCPVALSKSSCFPEIAVDAALYFDANNPNDIKETVEQLVDDPNLCEKMRQKGLERCALFSWEKAAGELLDVYNNVLNKE